MCISWSEINSVRTGRKVPGPTCRVTNKWSRVARISSLKCNPAVGAATDPYKALKTTLKAEIDEEAWESLRSSTSRPFPKPKSGRIAVKVINHLGDEVMKVFSVR